MLLTPMATVEKSKNAPIQQTKLKFVETLQHIFNKLDKKTNNAISFFFRHWGKSKFMVSMSKKIQMHGVEKVFLKSRKAFFYFFMFYLIRDTILYIIIPIYFAKSTGQ